MSGRQDDLTSPSPHPTPQTPPPHPKNPQPHPPFCPEPPMMPELFSRCDIRFHRPLLLPSKRYGALSILGVPPGHGPLSSPCIFTSLLNYPHPAICRGSCPFSYLCFWPLPGHCPLNRPWGLSPLQPPARKRSDPLSSRSLFSRQPPFC